jgi:chromosome partition protein MukB
VSRAKATALALVNWKGVFYERYLLDHNVTALEGANGAGKTTVMIAAYVVLFPDLGRLRFSNIGESGATGGDKGIWGRLGELGRPSYAVLQIQQESEVFLAGVLLERKTEPSLHLTPFLIRGLAQEIPLSELFLRRSEAFDEIPTLSEVKTAVERLNGNIQVFNSSKDYFAKLFDLGVSPLRLALDEERNKFNDMLRTSMTGGISRTLTSELRWFVFRQDLGLSDTLTRMRGSLDACRRTRTEVVEARRLEAEVSGIYQAAIDMVSAGYFAVRNLAQELFDGVSSAEKRREEAQALARARLVDANTINSELVSLSTNLSRLEQQRTACRDQAAHLTRALATLERLAALDQEHAMAQERQSKAHAAQTKATLLRFDLVAERRATQEAVAKSTTGLAHLQAGLDELHRRAHAFRAYRRHRTHLLSRFEVSESELDQGEFLANKQAALSAEVASTDAELLQRQRDGAQLSTRRAEFERARLTLEKLELLKHGSLTDGHPHTRAQTLLGQLQKDQVLAAQLPSLQEQLRAAQGLLDQQTTLISQLGSIDAPVQSSAALLAFGLELDERVREQEAQLRRAEWELKTGEENARKLERDIHSLHDQEAEWLRLEALAEQLETKTHDLTSREALRRLHNELADETRILKQTILGTEERLRNAQKYAATLEDMACAIDPELAALADAVEGELLARRYEDIEPNEASELEAELGPLVDAIVVEDVDNAARRLAELETPLETVWLVEAGTNLVSESRIHTGKRTTYVATKTQHGARLNRVKETSVLGKKAREKRLTALHKTIKQAELTLLQQNEQAHLAERKLATASELLSAASSWLTGSQTTLLRSKEKELELVRASLQTNRESCNSLPGTLNETRNSAERIRTLASAAHLLDRHSLTEEHNQLQAQVKSSLKARETLDCSATLRAELERDVHVLRLEPPSEDDVQRWQREHASLLERRDDRAALLQAIGELRALSPARDWQDAEDRLNESGELAPALEREHETSIQRLHAIETKLAAAESDWELATTTHQTASAETLALHAHITRARAELQLEGIDATDVRTHQERRKVLAEQAEYLDQEYARLQALAHEKSAEAARLDERRARASDEEQQANTLVTQLQAREQPARQAWGVLMTAARTSGVLSLLSKETTDASFAGAPSIDLTSQSRRHLSLLQERLQHSASGQRVASELATLAANTPTDHPLPILELWNIVRSWLTERVPARVAQAGDPLESLVRLRDELQRLEQHLATQEGMLRGESRDVSRNIEVQIRKATNQVRRLNQHLSLVTFGTIRSIRIRLDRVERTLKVLEALHDGSAQSLLFHSNLPIEEALEEIFRRYGGGKGGGQKLLDYREYIELTVEIQRRQSDEWERANPSRLSTGEAIGVGAALMMVILTEWERDANLMRSQKSAGTLRFLFLDEANRLSRDNLGVLFELCETLDLQLLIAAPEVAEVDGNTTYRLVRQVNSKGEDEVIVTGRRSVGVDDRGDAPSPGGALSTDSGARALVDLN